MTGPEFSIAVFPFLKTSGAIRIGGHTFRCTTDLADLPPEQAKAVSEIAQMLFVQGDLRVKSASYAVIPLLDIDGPSGDVDRLAYMRSVVTYFYASPHEIFDSLFLSPEEVSLVLFTPSPVSVFLARPMHHTESVSPVNRPTPNGRHLVPGYKGLYNFRHHFWIEPGSRLYGPKPHMILNISQNLQVDLEHGSRRPDYHLLLELLEKPLTPAAIRIYSALHWFNAANEAGIDADRALLNLCVAFEALLRLPADSKKERLVDAIALLLGRTERLDDWAEQFYAARSHIVHEGHGRGSYFYIPRSARQKGASGLFGSLMVYGRQVFQLCVGAVLVGIDLADRADLQEKLVTNNERYQKVARLLEDEAGTPASRLLNIEPIVRALKRYLFVPGAEIPTPTLISAVRNAAITLSKCGQEFAQELGEALRRVAEAKRENDESVALAAIELLETAFKNVELTGLTPEQRIVHDLVEIAWMNLFERYHWYTQRDQPDDQRS